MDNIENETPAGSDDVTSSPDNVSVDTQPVESIETLDGGTVEEAELASNPWDNDQKFKGKTSEDVYKAYQEAEKLNGQLSQKAQLANRISEKYGATPEQVLAQMEEQELTAQRERYAGNPLAPLVDEVSQLKQFVQQQQQEKAMVAVEKELDSYLKENPDYELNRNQLKKLALTSGIGFDPTTGSEVPIGELATEYFGKTRAQGQQDAYKKIDTKQMTQTTGTRSTPQKSISVEDMKNMSTSEMETFLQRA